MLTKFLVQAPTTYKDLSPIAAADLAKAAYLLFIDTIDPPVKSYAVPAADVAASVNGLITVNFTEIGFAPVPGTKYFATITDTVNGVSSDDAVELNFTNPLPVPNAPTFSVA
jgi:hypothetical protein